MHGVERIMGGESDGGGIGRVEMGWSNANDGYALVYHQSQK